MSGPADIPRFVTGEQGPDEQGPDEQGPDEVRNDAVRAAVEAFAADPGAPTVMDVLRHCLFGPLLLDVTGSEITLNDRGEIEEGSTIAVAGGEGPDGGGALFAFTSHAELGRIHPDGTQVQSLVQAAADVLEMARHQEAGWVYLDPAGPTCALAAGDIDFALRVPRNDAVRAALEPGVPREHLLAALHEQGPLSLAVEGAPEPGAGAGDGAGDGQPVEMTVRTADAPDGSGPVLLAFTSGPEVVAACPDTQIATQDTADLRAAVRDGGYRGVVLNPAGPWAYVSAAELG